MALRSHKKCPVGDIPVAQPRREGAGKSFVCSRTHCTCRHLRRLPFRFIAGEATACRQTNAKYNANPVAVHTPQNQLSFFVQKLLKTPQNPTTWSSSPQTATASKVLQPRPDALGLKHGACSLLNFALKLPPQHNTGLSYMQCKILCCKTCTITSPNRPCPQSRWPLNLPVKHHNIVAKLGSTM